MKDIVLFFDGTWEDGDKDVNVSHDTNVYLLYKYLRPSKNVISRYVTGVGTQESGFGDFFGGAAGTGINSRVMESLAYILDKYNPRTDRLTLVGFSRGAYTARCVSSWVTSQNVSVYMLFCFDTVCSYLFKGLEKMESNELSPLVDRGFQILAQNEDRAFFQPQIWNKASNVEQYRCKGVHTQIGGGNKERGISNFTLKVAAQEMSHIKFDLPDLAVNINEKPDPSFPRFTLGPRKFPDYVTSIMSIADVNGNLRRAV